MTSESKQVRIGLCGWEPQVEVVPMDVMTALTAIVGICLAAAFGDNTSGLFDDAVRATGGLALAGLVDEDIDPGLSAGLHVLDGTMYRVYPVQAIREDPYSVTSRFIFSALVPEKAGWVSVEVTVTCWSPWTGNHAENCLVEPLRVSVVWTATQNADENVVLAQLKRLLSEVLELADPDPTEDDTELPDVEMADCLVGVHAMLLAREEQLLELQRANNPVLLKDAREKLARAEKRNNKHIEQLKSELETQRAVSQRQRDRADAADRKLRQIANSTGGTQALQTASAQQESHISQLEAELAHAEHTAQQSSVEMDQLRAEVYRLREELASYRAAATPAASRSDTPPPAPATLRDISSWAVSRLKDRIVIHPKAVRAARKSTFADVALVYRVLEAMADSYWPMRFEGSQSCKKQWDSFMDAERLTCAHTGAAVQHHRTAETYHVNWQGQRVPLDQHIQGHSGRDEARTFRVYFHVDEMRKLVVIGHLPSHLPNSMT